MSKKLLRAALAALCLAALLLADAAPFSVVIPASAVTQAQIDAKKKEKAGDKAEGTEEKPKRAVPRKKKAEKAEGESE